MKKNFKILTTLASLLLFTLISCSGDGKTATYNGKSIDMSGTWEYISSDNFTFVLELTKDGSFMYGCNQNGARNRLSVSNTGGVVSSGDFNRWVYTGVYKVKNDILELNIQHVENYMNGNTTEPGDVFPYLIQILDENTVFIENNSRRRYIRVKNNNQFLVYQATTKKIPD